MKNERDRDREKEREILTIFQEKSDFVFYLGGNLKPIRFIYCYIVL